MGFFFLCQDVGLKGCGYCFNTLKNAGFTQFCIFLIQIIQATETGQIHAGFSGTGFV